jgi:hypothetical protein
MSAYPPISFKANRTAFSQSVLVSLKKRGDKAVETLCALLIEPQVQGVTWTANGDQVISIRSRDTHLPRGLPSGATAFIDPINSGRPCSVQHTVSCTVTRRQWQARRCCWISSAAAILFFVLFLLSLLLLRN